MIKNNKLEISTNRSFGLTFFAVFLIVGFWPLLNNETIRIWSIIISFVFLFLGLLNSKLLTPFNKIWFKFGILLGSIVSPIAMGLVFFIVVTPIGIVMRLLKKDILNRKFDKNAKSYWIIRDIPAGSLKNQF
jgi:predicted membrane metal-binding protein